MPQAQTILCCRKWLETGMLRCGFESHLSSLQSMLINGSVVMETCSKILPFSHIIWQDIAILSIYIGSSAYGTQLWQVCICIYTIPMEVDIKAWWVHVLNYRALTLMMKLMKGESEVMLLLWNLDWCWNEWYLLFFLFFLHCNHLICWCIFF